MLMAYMDRYLQAKGLRAEAEPRHHWLTEGIGVGVLGGAAVALWFLVLDMLTRSALYTPAALGSAVFHGAQGPAEIQKNFATIGSYTMLHFAVFIVLGVLFVWMVDRVQSNPRRWLIVMLAFILLDGLFVGTVAMFGVWVLESVGMWAIVVGNVIAILTMGGTLWATHPQMRHMVHKPVQPAV